MGSECYCYVSSGKTFKDSEMLMYTRDMDIIISDNVMMEALVLIMNNPLKKQSSQ